MMLPALILASAAAAAPLAPSGPWNVEYSENMCLLSRPYGHDADRFFVGFQPLFNSDRMDVIVVGASQHKEQHLGKARITADGETFDGNYVSVMLTTGELRVTRISVPAALFDHLGHSPTLAIKAGPIVATVAPTKFDKARPVFDKCQTDLLHSWGVDPVAVEKDHAPKPIQLARHFSSATYPQEALKAGIIGRVTAVVKVDATGAVTDCRVVASAGKELNDGTCKQARYVQYRPATDHDGHPVASIDILTVRWVMG